MKRLQMRTSLRPLVMGAAILTFVARLAMPSFAQTAPPTPPQTATAPGTVINNTATASYTDANNQSYSTASNTVSTTVQNAPSVFISPQAQQTVAPNQIVIDTFGLYNTGNGAATFTVTGPASPVGAGGTFVGYIVNNAATGTCSIANPCTSAAAVNAYLATLPTNPVGGTAPTSQLVGIEYRISPTATPGSTVTTTLTATSSQAVAGGQPAQTSPAITATDTDIVAASARIDLQKTATQPTSAAGNITFQIAGNNGGGFSSRDLAAVNALLGSAITSGRAGILLTDKIPTFTGTGTTPPLLVNDAAVALAATVSATDSYKIVYSTDPNGAPGSWSTSFSATATYIGVYIYNTTAPTTGVGGTPVLPSNPTGSTGAGVAPPASSVSSPQFTLTFHVTQPTGPGSGNGSALSNIANAVGAGNPNANGILPVIGTGIAQGTPDSPTLSLTSVITNTTPSSGTISPGGASNTVNASAFASAVAFVGPISFPEASGQAPPLTTGYTQNNDYTALGFVCANNASATAQPQTSNPTSCTVPAGGIDVPNTLENKGNIADVFTIAVTPPAGYTATIYTTNCPVPSGGFTIVPSNTLNPKPASVCTRGALIATTTTGGVTSGAYPTAVASGATADFIVVYSAATGVQPGVVADALVQVTGTQTASFPTSDTNTTHDDLYPGGAITYSKVQKILSDGCPSSGGSPAFAATPIPVCPGGVIEYDILFANSAPAVATAANAGNTEPSFATKALTSLNLMMAEDGNATVNGVANNWGANTFGLNGAITQTSVGGAPAASLNYTVGTSFSTGTYPAKSAGYTAFTATVAPINPGQGGTLVFNVTVK